MPRTKEQFEEMRTATREKIKTSATQLFAQRGFAATNVQEIADLSEISIGLLYKYYKTKDELFGELVGNALAGIENLVEYFSDFSEPRKTFMNFINLIYQDMIKDDEFSNLLILMTQAAFANSAIVTQDEITELDVKVLTAMSNLIAKGQECGDFREGDTYAMATQFFAIIQGLAIMKITMHDKFCMPSPSIMQAMLIKENI